MSHIFFYKILFYFIYFLLCNIKKFFSSSPVTLRYFLFLFTMNYYVFMLRTIARAYFSATENNWNIREMYTCTGIYLVSNLLYTTNRSNKSSYFSGARVENARNAVFNQFIYPFWLICAMWMFVVDLYEILFLMAVILDTGSR